MKNGMAVFAGLALAACGWADEPSVTLDGFVVTGAGVKQITVVEKLPFTVKAPVGGILYRWDVPPTVPAPGGLRGQTLTILDAQPGELVLTISYAVIDFKAMTAEEKSASVTVFIAGPAPPPIPPAPVIDPALLQSLQAAYNADPDLLRSAHVAALADLLGNVVAAAKASKTTKAVLDPRTGVVNNVPAIATDSDFQALVKQATDRTIGETALTKVRPAIGAYLQTKLDRKPNDPVSDAYWTSAAAAYGNVAAALKGLVK